MNNNKTQKVLLAAAKTIPSVALIISLLGCEAALDLSGVEATLDQPIRRTDQIQGFAQNTRVQVAVGNFGLVLHRDQGAQDWQRLELPEQPGLIAVSVCPNNTFVALSFERQVWLGSEDGAQWQSKAIATPENLLDITCAPDGSIWAVGSFSTMLSSQDSGDSWTEFSLNEDAMLTSIQFLNNDLAYAAGEFGLVVKTTDAGQNWEVLPPIQYEFYPQTTLFSDEQNGWAVGLDGTVYQTTDGAQSWQLGSAGVDAPLYQVLIKDNQQYLLGDNATLLRSDDDSWQPIELPSPPVYLSSGIFTENQLLVAGGNGVLLSVDL